MKTMKKIVAWASAITLIAMNLANLTVNAAGVVTTVASADRQTFTIDLPAWVNLTTNDDITLVVKNATTWAAIDLSANQITALTVGWVDEFVQTAGNRGNANGTIIVTNLVSDPLADDNVVFTLTSALPINTAYSVAYMDNQGNFSNAVANFGTANQVTVSATVLPTLTMSLDTTTLNLGNLDTVAYADQTVTVTTSTNAVGWADITMGSTWLKDTNIDREIWVNSLAAQAQTAAADRYLYTVGWAIWAWSTDMTASQVVLNGTNIANSNAATAVHIGAIVGATTEAWNYSDTLTFSVTGSF